MLKLKKNIRGFTLVEMLVGIALFGILIPAIVIGLNSVAILNDSSKDLAIANIYAENKMEELRSIGYNSIGTGTVDISSTLPATLGRSRSGVYSVTNNVPGIKEVHLTITIGTRGGTRTLNYKTDIGELGVGQ